MRSGALPQAGQQGVESNAAQEDHGIIEDDDG